MAPQNVRRISLAFSSTSKSITTLGFPPSQPLVAESLTWRRPNRDLQLPVLTCFCPPSAVSYGTCGHSLVKTSSDSRRPHRHGWLVLQRLGRHFLSLRHAAAQAACAGISGALFRHHRNQHF